MHLSSNALLQIKPLCETVLLVPTLSNRLPGEHSTVEPPDSIPNSEVKRRRADGSVDLSMRE